MDAIQVRVVSVDGDVREGGRTSTRVWRTRADAPGIQWGLLQAKDPSLRLREIRDLLRQEGGNLGGRECPQLDGRHHGKHQGMQAADGILINLGDCCWTESPHLIDGHGTHLGAIKGAHGNRGQALDVHRSNAGKVLGGQLSNVLGRHPARHLKAKLLMAFGPAEG